MTITGPSCAGKGYLLNHLLENYPDKFVSLLTYTTRAMREGEVEGFEYNFIDAAAFKVEHDAGNLCQVVNFGGQFYGTPRVNLEKAFESGKTPIRIVEPGGVGQFERVAEEFEDCSVFSVFISEEKEVIVERWLERLEADLMMASVHERAAHRKYYARRLTDCMEGEFEWHKARSYNFHINGSKHPIPAMAHALSRICTGQVHMSMANRFQPYSELAA
jgi:guanylate kinase